MKRTPAKKRSIRRRRLLKTLAMKFALMAPAVGVLSYAGYVHAISLGTIDVAYTQNFDTLANSGTSSTLPTGWAIAESGSNANTTYTAGTGSNTAGDTYSFGAAASTERALGGLLSGSLNPTFGAMFTNNTGVTVNALDIAYTGEMWRAGVTNRNAADRIDFQYSLDATSLTTGTWMDVDTLDYNSSNINTSSGATDGNTASFRTNVSGSISDSIANGVDVWIRWTDFNISGSDDGLAVDDFSITPRNIAPPPPPATTSLVINEFHANPASGLLGDANMDGTRSATQDEFVEIVNTGATAADISGFTLSDANGVTHTFPMGTVLPTGGAVVVFGGDGNPFPMGAFGGAIVQVADADGNGTGNSISLNNGGDTITITETNTAIAAQVIYGSAPAESLNLDPDLTGGSYSNHSTIAGSGGALYSPGTFVDGTPFETNPFSHVLPNAGGATTIDFATFAGDGFAKVPTAGQLDSDVFGLTGLQEGSVAFGLTKVSGDFALGASQGGESQGGIYAFDVSNTGGATPNMALGVQPAGSDFTPGAFLVRLLNDTGSPIDDLDVAFDLFVYNDQDSAQTFDFAYSIDGVNFTSLPTGFVWPGLADQLPSWLAQSFSASLTSLGLADGKFLYLRFASDDATGGTRDEWAIDNITVSQPLPPVPEPMTSGLLLMGGAMIALRRRPAH